jgi:hypothetical protein
MEMSKNLFLILLLFAPRFMFSQGEFNFAQNDNCVVVVEGYDYAGRKTGHGSGVLVDASKGQVVTNYHVLEGANSFKVLFRNGKKISVTEIEKGSKSIDLAILKLPIDELKGMKSAVIAKKIPSKGEKCGAIGTPADVQYMNTVSEGLVSNIHPQGIQVWTGYTLQINAEIAHGSSGGGLFNVAGELIGITCGGETGEDGARASINFAVSISEMNNLPSVHLKSLIDPKSIPCDFSFFTNDSYTGDVLLYVNQIYVGKFYKFFQPGVTPSCGQDGTLTLALPAGVYSYQVYYSNINQYTNGYIELTPGGCKLVRVQGIKVEYTPWYVPWWLNTDKWEPQVSLKNSVSFDIGLNSIDYESIYFSGNRYGLSYSKYYKSRKFAFQSGFGFCAAVNHNQTTEVYNYWTGNYDITYYDTKLRHFDIRSEMKYRFLSTHKKDRFISAGLMLNANYVKGESISSTGAASTIINKSHKFSLTPIISYSKEKHFNTKWSFNGEITLGKNLFSPTNYIYVGVGLRFRPITWN